MDNTAAPERDAGADAARVISSTSYRLWFYGYLVLFASGVAVVLWQGLPPQRVNVGWTTVVFLYCSLAMSLFPLPTTGMLLLVGTLLHRVYPVLSAGGVGAIAVVVTAAAAGTAVANLNEYHLLSMGFRSSKMAAIREYGFYRRAVRLFDRQPFMLMVMMNMLPLPVDVVRWLAIAHRYPRPRYALAIFFGRWVRYALILGAGWGLNLPLWAIAAVMVALALLGLAKSWLMSRGEEDGSG